VIRDICPPGHINKDTVPDVRQGQAGMIRDKMKKLMSEGANKRTLVLLFF